MTQDIREIAYINHEDVVALNFIHGNGPYVFRRHCRQGLRSHILEVLPRADIERERSGLLIQGYRWFPKARPVKMFRIFRTKLKTLETALDEIRRVKIVEHFLAPDFIAHSDEFVVDYQGPGGREPLLCGFQAYVEGEIVDPWSILDKEIFVRTLYDALRSRIDSRIEAGQWIGQVQQKAARFIHNVKEMIAHSGYVPDLAGIGNLVVAGSGDIKLVDINNISKVRFDTAIHLDDRHYPVCDKSIEALFLIEEKMTGRSANRHEPLYRTFLDPQRKKDVKAHEAAFYHQKASGRGYPPLQR